MEPITIGSVLIALVSFVVSAVNRLTENPIMAYFLVLAVLIADASVSLMIGQGLVGGLITPIVNGLGVPITIFSWQITILFGIFPVVVFALRSSVHK
jgi:hypothetical protein